MKIAFIGLGNMGGGMAANLAKAGHDVRAFDLSEEALARAVEAGCARAASAAEAVNGAEAVVTMLPAGKHVASVYEADVFPNAAPGTLLLDCSTIDVATARSNIEAATAKGLVAVDAPVSGGIAAANAGTLTFMVGGTDEGFARAEPILAKMGKAVIHAGDAGAGQAAKICNNMLLGASMVATCEAFVLAQKLGLDPQKFFDIASVVVGPVLVDDHLCAAARRRADDARRQRLSGRFRRRADAQGFAACDGGGGQRRRRCADGQPRARAL